MDQTAMRAQFNTNPLHAILLAFPVALYPSALLSDITYLNTAEVQWTNFSSWLIAGADFFAGLVLASAILSLLFGRSHASRHSSLTYIAIVAAMFVAGVVNAFQHARDGWHSVGTFGLILSILCTLLALAAAWFTYGSPRRTETRA